MILSYHKGDGTSTWKVFEHQIPTPKRGVNKIACNGISSFAKALTYVKISKERDQLRDLVRKILTI